MLLSSYKSQMLVKKVLIQIFGPFSFEIKVIIHAHATKRKASCQAVQYRYANTGDG